MKTKDEIIAELHKELCGYGECFTRIAEGYSERRQLWAMKRRWRDTTRDMLEDTRPPQEKPDA